MTNPFATAPQQAPAMISDQAAQQFGAPAQPQYSPGPQADYAQPVQHQQAQPGQQLAQQAGVPGAAWTPAQHAAQVPQMGAPQQAYAPPAQQLPQAPFPPAVQQQAAPAFAQPQQAPQGFGAPAQQAAPTTGGPFDPSMWGAPSPGGGGTYPKVRDIEGRLCLIRTKNRNSPGTDYNDKTKTTNNYVANVAVLDGGPIYASPNAENPMAQPELVSETVPYVVSDMLISQVGLQNRLKNDFVRGRMMRHPKGELEKQLNERFPGMAAPFALFTALQQGMLQQSHLVSGTFFWTIVEDASPEADQLVSAFAQHPAARELMA